MREDLIESLRVIAQWLDQRAHFESEPETKASHVEDADTCREAAAALEAAREDACVSLVADIRFACGDNGKRMQPELVEFIRGLAEDSGRYRFVLTKGKLPLLCSGGYFYEDGVLHSTAEAAIDQARGKGEP